MKGSCGQTSAELGRQTLTFLHHTSHACIYHAPSTLSLISYNDFQKFPRSLFSPCCLFCLPLSLFFSHPATQWDLLAVKAQGVIAGLALSDISNDCPKCSQMWGEQACQGIAECLDNLLEGLMEGHSPGHILISV